MSTGQEDSELALRDYLAILGRRWIWVLLPLLIVPPLAAYLNLRQPDLYVSSARVLLANTAAQDAVAGPLNINTGVRSRELANEINLAESDATTDRVRAKLGLGPQDDLPKGAVRADADADVLTFRFFGPAPADAARSANTWATAYVELKQETAQTSIDQAVARLEARLAELRTRRSEIRTNLEELELRLGRAVDDQTRNDLQFEVDREASSISGELNLVDAQIASNIQSITELQLSSELASVGTATLLQNAAEPKAPTNAPLSQHLIIGIAVSLVAGVALAMLLESLDHTIGGVDDIRRLGYTVLGAVPKAPRDRKHHDLATIAQSAPDTPTADGYQKVRTALQFATLGGDVKSILVTSPKQGDGKTTTAVNLALAFASVDRQVVLADVDFRRPRIHDIFNAKLVPGVSDALLQGVPLGQMVVRHPELSTTLVAIPAGTQPPNPATFLSLPVFAALLSEIRGQADLAIFDAPPVLPVADALSLCPVVDGVVIVVSAGNIKEDELVSAVDSIERSGGKLLGVVVNNVKTKASRYTYGTPQKPTKAPASPAKVTTG